jgi:hypothetical protein
MSVRFTITHLDCAGIIDVTVLYCNNIFTHYSYLHRLIKHTVHVPQGGERNIALRAVHIPQGGERNIALRALTNQAERNIALRALTTLYITGGASGACLLSCNLALTSGTWNFWCDGGLTIGAGVAEHRTACSDKGEFRA